MRVHVAMKPGRAASQIIRLNRPDVVLAQEREKQRRREQKAADKRASQAAAALGASVGASHYQAAGGGAAAAAGAGKKEIQKEIEFPFEFQKERYGGGSLLGGIDLGLPPVRTAAGGRGRGGRAGAAGGRGGRRASNADVSCSPPGGWHSPITPFAVHRMSMLDDE